jgi:hypothetical protein
VHEQDGGETHDEQGHEADNCIGGHGHIDDEVLDKQKKLGNGFA